MAKEVLSEKYDAFVYAHNADVASKEILLIGGNVVMALNASLADVENVYVYRASAIRVPKVAAQAWAIPGTAIYWDNTAKNFTTTLTSNTLAGYVAVAALSADTEGVIDLDPSA